jgi:L-fuconolactonase
MGGEMTDIVDAHTHYWDPAAFQIEWIRSRPGLARAWLPEDYARDAAGLAVRGVVFVEANVTASAAVREARWASLLSRGATPLRAIVAHAMVDDPRSLAAQLDALAQNVTPVRGVRRNIQGERDARAVCAAPGFLESMTLLADRGLSFDICVTHDQLPAIIELVEHCPGTAFVLDHLGKPAIAAARLDPWRDHVRALATASNVVGKVSGLATEADPRRWSDDDLRPYVEHAAESFGEDRLLFGGDWPVVRIAGGLRRWVEALGRITCTWSQVAREKLWSENARRVYRLDA